MLDALFIIKLSNKEIKLGGKHMYYDNMYPAATQELVDLLKNGVTDAKELEEKNNFGLILCDDTNVDVVSTIDFDNQKVYMEMIELEYAEDFMDNWGIEFVDKDGKAYVKWEDDYEEPLLNAEKEIDKIYPLLNKEFLSFDELKEYVDFLDWCEQQESTTIEYCDSLLFKFNMI